MRKPNHILIIRLSAMGDVAMSVPVILTLLAQHSNIQVTVVSKPFFKPLFQGIDRLTFKAIDTQDKHKGLWGIYKLFQELNTLEIDAVADLHDVLRSKILRFLFTISGKKVISIHKGRTEKKALTSLKNKIFRPLKSTHQRYADVFATLGNPIDLSQYTLKNKEDLNLTIQKKIKYNPQYKYIGIAPFAAHAGKKYPLSLMEQVISELSKNHIVLLFGGGQHEVDLLTKIENKDQNIINLAGKFSLPQELAIISHLDVMVSMDSGNGHFSAMYGIPTVTIWGATHPYAGFAPFMQNEHCITADRKKFPLLPTSVYGNKTVKGYEQVMKSIHPDEVIEKVNQIIQN